MNTIERYQAIKDKMEAIEKNKIQLEIMVDQCQKRLDTMNTTLKDQYGLNSIKDAKEHLVAKEKELEASIELMETQLTSYEAKLKEVK